MCSHCMQHISKWATSSMLLPYRRYSLVGEICEYLNIPLLDRCEYLGLRCDIGGWNRIRMDFGRTCHKPLKTFPPWGAGVKKVLSTHPPFCSRYMVFWSTHIFTVLDNTVLDWESKGWIFGNIPNDLWPPPHPGMMGNIPSSLIVMK